jgi:hypothetical protein
VKGFGELEKVAIAGGVLAIELATVLFPDCTVIARRFCA